MNERTDEERGQAIEALCSALEDTAEWRMRKQAEHPDDTRNSEASRQADALSKLTVATPSLLDAYLNLYDGETNWADLQSTALRQIGFSAWPETLDDVIREVLTFAPHTAAA